MADRISDLVFKHDSNRGWAMNTTLETVGNMMSSSKR